MVDGRAKGNNFENVVCRGLSRMLCPEQDWTRVPVRRLPFRRRFTDVTPLDGHWEGEGDVLHVPGIVCPFCIEAKDQEGWELDGLVKNTKWRPWGWWEQCKEQAGRTDGLWPVLFFTRNFRPIYVLVERELQQCLEIAPEQAPVLCVRRPGGERLTIARMQDFLAVPLGRVRALKERSQRETSSSSCSTPTKSRRGRAASSGKASLRSSARRSRKDGPSS